MIEKKLEELIEKYRKLTKKQKEKMNEQTVRQEYIDVFLSLLGWDVTNSNNLPYSEREVLVEEFSNKSDKPDYTLRKYGQAKFFVEAKRPSIDISVSEDSIYQSRKYGWNANHKIVILTNFERLIIYQTYKEPEREKLIGKYEYRSYNFSEYLDKFEEIHQLISKGSIESGYYDEWTDNIVPENVMKHSLDSVFLEKINKWRIKIGQSLYNSKNEKFHDEENLNFYTQKLLNQIIFLRFTEDNELEIRDTLKKFLDKEIDTKAFLKKLDRKYNSELFDSDTIKYIEKEILSEVVLELYYPNTSFDFSIIPLDILSEMYENYLQKELAIIETEKIELVETRDIKVKSVVSTPNEIVKFMVKEAVQDKIKNKSRNEILDLKICDIAVGSGVFLIEAYNIIESHLIDYYSSKDDLTPTPLIVPFQDKVSIISEVLYGMDINILAIQLTRFSLVLRVLRDESRQKDETYPILPSLKDNIINANTLVSEDDLDIINLSNEKIKDISPRENEIFKGLDVIIGNPPYLNTEDIKASTTKEEIKVYKQEYKSSYMQYDKYFLFIEKAIMLSLENPEIKTTLIVLNKFITSKSGMKLREYIKENRALKKIINFKYTQLFEGVTTYVCILNLELNNDQFEYIEVDSIEDIYNKESLIYDTSLLTDEGWFLIDDLDFLKKYESAIKKFPSITEEIEVSNGIQTSRNPIYVIKGNEIIDETDKLLKFTKNSKEYFIEKEILRKYFTKTNSKDVSKSYENLKSNSYVIFPYEEGKTYKIADMKTKYGYAWEYLTEYKEELLKRDMRGGNEKHWYRFGRSQHLKELDDEKLIVGVMSNQPSFNIDRNNYLISSGGTAGYIAILVKENSPYSLEYLQAWLSHSFTDIIFKTIGSDFEGDFYTHGTYLYDAIPLLPIDFEDPKEKEIYDEINNYVKDVEKINIEIFKETNERNNEINRKRKKKYIENINKNIDDLIEKKLGDSN